MAKHWFTCSLIVFFLIISAFLLPAPSLPEQIAHALDSLSTAYPQEKVYLQLDKDYYANGESIWFKAYVTSQNKPTYVSQNLHVQLVDDSGKIVSQKILRIKEGGAPGEFQLSETLPEGTYHIRAFTSWMLNFDQAFLYTKDIQVFDPRKNSLPETIPANKQYSVQFFPEGGDLVEGVTSKVAFKAINSDGDPLEVQGKIVDNQGKEITRFQSVHDGMGVFQLSPQPNTLYKAVLIQADGSARNFDLPAAKPSGATLQILSTNNRVFFLVSRGEKDKEKYNHLWLAAQMQHELVFLTDINFGENKIGGGIPLNNLPSGIMQVTLFDEAGTPLAERLVFVMGKHDLHLELGAANVSFSPRALNVLELTSPEVQKGNFSVSVTDADQVTPLEDADNIISNLLLTSDIKGHVHHPAYYFKDQQPATLKALDLVMMTNGWRRFKWELVLHRQFPAIHYPVERGLVLKGRVFAGRSIASGGKVDMIVKAPADSISFLVSAPIDAMGNFYVDQLDFHDTASIYFQGTDARKNWQLMNVKFLSDPWEHMQFAPFAHPVCPSIIRSNSALLHFLKLSVERNQVNRMINNRVIYLQEINVKGKRIPQEETMDKKYASGLFSGGDGYAFDLTKENTMGYFNIFQYLQGRVAGLLIDGNSTNPAVSWRGGSPSFYLNEMPIDKSFLSNIPINDIAYVKVFRPPFLGGFGGGGNGAIAIYTKKGGEARSEDTRGFSNFKKAGYNIVREFYSPDYAIKKEVHQLPDKRVTLYWNPDLHMDSTTHRLRIRFYNTDITRRYRVVVEGLDVTGRLGRVEKLFQ